MSTERYYWVYILASRIGGTLYVGVTNNLLRRSYEHKSGELSGFTKQYAVHRLVYYEPHNDIEAAIRREKRLKKWNRAWKIRLIEENNPNWDDLYPQIASPYPPCFPPHRPLSFLSSSAKADDPVNAGAAGDYWMPRLRAA